MATLTKRFYKTFFFRLYKTRMATLLFGLDVFLQRKNKTTDHKRFKLKHEACRKKGLMMKPENN